MELQVQQLADGIDKISLAGRLDGAGVQEIDLRFTALTATKKAQVLVDLSEVSFLASIGIRTLVTNARALKLRGGAMALLNPQPLVEEVLKVAGIESLLPVFHDLDAASGALRGAAEST
jgi:anti-anti-sigma factor